MIGDRIKELRKKKGYTQQHVADITGIKVTAICHYEKGNRVPNIRNLIKIASALECDINEIINI